MQAEDAATLLKQRRTDLGKTQLQVARAANVSENTVARLEGMPRLVYSRALPAIVAALDRLEAEAETGNAAQAGRGAAITDGGDRPHHAG